MVVGLLNSAEVVNFFTEAKNSILRHCRNTAVIMDNASIHHSSVLKSFL
jgi:hypothetical protein